MLTNTLNESTIDMDGLKSLLKQKQTLDKGRSIKMMRGYLSMLHRQTNYQLDVQHQINLKSASNHVTTIKEDPRKLMTPVIADYKKHILLREDQLIKMKQQKFSMFDQLEDLYYELQQNKKMLKFFTITIQEREQQIVKLFDEIQCQKKNKTIKQNKSNLNTSFINSPKMNQSMYTDHQSQSTERVSGARDDDSFRNFSLADREVPIYRAEKRWV